jgi:hypothetical protein
MLAAAATVVRAVVDKGQAVTIIMRPWCLVVSWVGYNNVGVYCTGLRGLYLLSSLSGIDREFWTRELVPRGPLQPLARLEFRTRAAPVVLPRL